MIDHTTRESKPHQDAALLALLEAHHLLEMQTRYLQYGQYAPRLMQMARDALDVCSAEARSLVQSDAGATKDKIWKT